MTVKLTAPKRKNLFDGKPGPGRPKGVPNKTTTAIKDLIIGALDKAGGLEYLVKQANTNPTAFLTLVGKVIPLQVAGDPDNPVKMVTIVELVAPSIHARPD